MAQEHVDIAEAELHETKGISTAVAGASLIADGAGSGEWREEQVGGSMSIGHTTDNTTATTATALDTWYVLAGTWTEDFAVSVTDDGTTGKFTVDANEGGIYEMSLDISFIMSRNSDIASISVMKNGAYVVGTPRLRRKVGTGTDVGALSMHVFMTLVATDYVQAAVMLRTSDGSNTAGDTLTVENGIFTIRLVKATI